MNARNRKKRALSGLKSGVALAALFSLGVAPCAVAQDEIDVIIVTAQKREQNLLDVPISINVLSGEALERQNIGEFDAVSQFVPNFRFADAGTPGTYSFVIIRGLANGLGTVEPRVSVYVDGVPTADFFSLNSELLDVERIEVLRGPQSTLYGLNSQAGVINIVSRLPGDEYRIKGNVEYNNLDEVTVGGTVSGPIVKDVLSVGASINYRDGGDFITQQPSGEELLGQEALSARVQVQFTPTENLEFLFTGVHQDLDQDSGRIQLPIDQAAYNLVNGTSVGDFEYAGNVPGFSETQTQQISLRTTYEGQGFDVVSVTSYREFEFANSFDLTHNPSDLPLDLPFGTFTFLSGVTVADFEQFYQELRIQSNNEGPFEWTIGGSYYGFEESSSGSLDGIVPTALGEREGTTWGVFGQGTYRLWQERLGLTAGLRYEETTRDVADLLNAVEFDTSDSIILPRLVVDYKFTEELMAYASVTRGWLSGGAEIVGDPANALYDTETSWVYEIGVRGSAADGALGYKASGYYTEASDYQDLILEGAFNSFLSNAEKVTIKGFELELNANLIENLNFVAGFGYSDAEYDSFLLDSLNNVRIDGNSIVGVPDYDFSVIANYSLPNDFYLQGEFLGAGEFALDQLNTAFASGYEVLNFRLGYQGGTFSGYVYVENVEDDQYFTSGIVDPFAGVVGIVGGPRTFGVRISAELD